MNKTPRYFVFNKMCITVFTALRLGVIIYIWMFVSRLFNRITSDDFVSLMIIIMATICTADLVAWYQHMRIKGDIKCTVITDSHGRFVRVEGLWLE